MPEASFLRHSGWVAPEDFEDTINIVGVGATGSHIALCLAKMGATKFKIWDADHVEAHNLPNQVYEPEHIGMQKVDALSRVLSRFNPAISVEKVDRFFTTEQDKETLKGPLVLTVDTMSARKDIYDTFKSNLNIPFVIETRLGFDFGELYVIDPMDVERCARWGDNLVSDEEIPDSPCDLTICTTLVGIVSSLATHALCSYYAAERAEETWSFNFRTMVNLDPKIKTIVLN